ncbi:hypothetical protein FOCC_FOCC004735 [Frankliniella occidentalis]|uniref:Gametocyte-specific factor 1 isoform X1 n=1 Tax=Frankliniella occidentalis TaxID=133901 RepID=A0A6J1T995_FRAOC|nr:gametocyte-specific factor 1 isoform X1 [Frankliniella occidentalis]KAE8748559.1 hypothetical protein FOCC_FOCC004735 [Frankliniella occidentalis]
MSAAINNPYVSCPYDKSHAVPKLRLQRHLMKCRKNHPKLAALFKSCPFNATHVIPEQELQMHFMFCSDRHLMEAKKYENTTVHGELGNPQFHLPVPVGDWEDEEDEQASIDMIYAPRNVHRPEPSDNRNEFRRGGALGAPIYHCQNSRDDEEPIMPKVLGMGRGRFYARLDNSE